MHPISIHFVEISLFIAALYKYSVSVLVKCVPVLFSARLLGPHQRIPQGPYLWSPQRGVGVPIFPTQMKDEGWRLCTWGGQGTRQEAPCCATQIQGVWHHHFQTKKCEIQTKSGPKYQPSGAGGTRSPPATPNRLPVGPKMADGVWKRAYP